MFATGTFQPTYFGPITASGDLVRRMRSSGMAQANFSGAERAYRPMKIGIGAGSAMTQYQGGLAGDTERAKGYAAAQQAIGDYGQNVADATLGYQTGLAGEQNNIRNLYTQQKQINQSAELDLRKLGLDAALTAYQRQVQQKANAMKNNSSIFGMLAGLAQ